MSTNVNYNSLMAIPSDYDNNDGTLDMAINLIPENAALKPVQRPKNVFELGLKPKEVVVGMHKVNTQINVIYYLVNNNKTISISWSDYADKTSQGREEIEIIEDCEIKDFEIIGNTFILATSKGIRYYLWSNNKYIGLGERPPFLPICFGMVEQGSADNVMHTINISADIVNGIPSSQSLIDASNAFFGEFNKVVEEKITRQGLFYQPFFVRYAYKLYDGSHWWCSAPVLMMPSVMIPKVEAYGDVNEGHVGSDFKSLMTYQLQYCVMSIVDSRKIRLWSDLISGIDVFISAPIYTYTTENFSIPAIREYKWLQILTPFHSIANDTLLSGCSGKLEGGKLVFKENTVSELSNDKCWNIKENKKFLDKIKGQQSFYQYASLSLKDVYDAIDYANKGFQSFTDLQLYSKDLANLASRPELKDDYLSFASVAGNCLYAMNGRLNVGGADIIPSEPFPINSVSQPIGNYTDTTGLKDVFFRVWIKSNGQVCKVEHRGSALTDKWLLGGDMGNFNFPYWIYYPHPGAFRMEIGVGNVSKIVSLVQHPFLNGAYFFRTSVGDFPTMNVTDEVNSNSIANPAKVYTSEINNPFIFYPDKINTIGSGSGVIKALASANKPLSQGQFGEFPIYAFTNEGVWALTISDSGAIASKQPIVRDVALAKESILQLDDSVLFATDKGIMAIQGAGTENTTYPVLADGEFDITLLPKFDKVIELFNGYSQKKSVPYNLAVKDLANVDSYSYLCGCRMVYDYKNARVIIFNPNNKVALVYSLKSKMWGQMYSDFEYPINAYPEALAVSKGGRIVDLSEPMKADESIAIALMTRPFALGDSDVFKTIQAIIQRGRFDKNKVKQILYGSNDLYNWQIVWSSDNAYMSGFSGEPYKSFRIAVIGDLDLGDALSRFSVDYRQKQTNKLR